MNGILIIDKRSGMTSHDVVAKIRKILGTKKVGHTGTLDPDATGVLVACIGRATKLSGFLMATSKEYIAGMELGVETDSLDRTGRVVSETKDFSVTRAEMQSAFDRLTGEIEQVPPMVSAVRHRGKKLYELARKGKEVERQARKVTIHSLELLEFNPPELTFRVECSKGTYIRTLCSDIGDMLGCGAHQTSLVRTRSGPFHIKQASTLRELENMEDPSEKIIPPEEALSFLPEVKVKKWFRRFVTRNAVLTAADIIEKPGLEEGMTLRITDPDNELLAVGRASSEEGGEISVSIVHRVKSDIPPSS